VRVRQPLDDRARDRVHASATTAATAPSRYTRRVSIRGNLEALATVAGATVVAAPLAWLVEPGTLTTLYLLAVVVVAVRAGRGPAVVAALGSVAAFDFFFIPPYFTFAVAHPQYLLTFGVMLVVGLVVGTLTARLRRQAEDARARERWTAALATLAAAAGRTADADDLARAASDEVARLFAADVTVLLANASGALRPVAGAECFPVDEGERAAAERAFAARAPAGKGTAFVVDAPALCLPLVAGGTALGVVVLRLGSRPDADDRRRIETFVSHVALALERCRLAGEAHAARVAVDTERLRASLLTSVSHDLRTPLTAITGAVTTLLDRGERLDRRTQTELLEAVRDEADRLNRLVQNLLEITRLESGALRVQRQWHPLEEVVGAALGRLGRALGGRKVTVTIPPDMPLVAIDDVLIEQALFNLLDNAAKYTPPASPVRILVTAGGSHVTVEIADHGPGLPRGQEDRVFEKFHRATSGGRGAGLGLAICRGIVEAHGGRIWAQNLPEGGVAFLFTLPLSNARPTAVPTDA
jgi:two-component system, OmpR family, sensor histidine kinase KdpD